MYTKPAITLDAQITLLQSRSMLIYDVAYAKHILSCISYYRLVGYWWPMQADKITHQFKPGSRFEDVVALYSFDKALRILVFDVIEVIEIALRTKLIYHLSHEAGPWWFQETGLFSDVKEHVKTLANLEEEVSRSKDTFIVEHKKKHKTMDAFRQHGSRWKKRALARYPGCTVT